MLLPRSAAHNLMCGIVPQFFFIEILDLNLHLTELLFGELPHLITRNVCKSFFLPIRCNLAGRMQVRKWI